MAQTQPPSSNRTEEGELRRGRPVMRTAFDTQNSEGDQCAIPLDAYGVFGNSSSPRDTKDALTNNRRTRQPGAERRRGTRNRYDPLMHIHLEPIGGIAGDMFAAAMLHAWPEQVPRLATALAAITLPAGVTAAPAAFNDGTITGVRFLVTTPADHAQQRRLRDICALLEASALAHTVRRRAIAIFTLLAEIEGKVHGVAPDDVTFHEVGAWDSIVDIVAAAVLIEATGARSWSVAAIPIGSGRVRTAHGEMPVPTPAVVLLLDGFPVFDDGRPGERVTPTGAAILRHLSPDFALPRGVQRQGRVGYGFGTKRFKGISNVLRVLAFDPMPDPSTSEEIGVLRFEIDDQTPEDLAIGLARVRAAPGVIDVLQAPVFGKKGRMIAQIQVLTTIDTIESVAARCLAETTTLGLRIERVTRRTLARAARAVTDTDGREMRVKTATRPDGTVTTKAEMDDIAAASGDHADRTRRRRRVERAASKEEDRDG